MSFQFASHAKSPALPISWCKQALVGLACLLIISCSKEGPRQESKPVPSPPVTYFKVDPATAGSVTGTVHYVGKRPKPELIDMSGDPACMEAHQGKAHDESLVVNPNGTLANVFIYVKSGLAGKTFEVPSTPVTIDQRGCWFHPRVLGIQVGQRLSVVNSDPVTHNIHPMAVLNREWNHSQGQGDPPLARKFLKPEVMIRVKCNIHSWMHAFIGVVDNPYYAVTGADGKFKLDNLPPGNYVIEAWQEKLGTQDANITVGPSGKIESSFTFKGE